MKYKQRFKMELPGGLSIALYKHVGDMFNTLEISDGCSEDCALVLSDEELETLARNIEGTLYND